MAAFKLSCWYSMEETVSHMSPRHMTFLRNSEKIRYELFNQNEISTASNLKSWHSPIVVFVCTTQSVCLFVEYCDVISLWLEIAESSKGVPISSCGLDSGKATIQQKYPKYGGP